MEIGIASLTCQAYPADPRTHVELYRDAIAVAEEAERLGFAAVWLSEHHFVDDGYSPGCLPLAAAIAARTSRIAIGTGVLLGPLYEPVRLAEDAATVDLISNGRLELGLGIGWRAEEFEGLRLTLRGSRQRFEDLLATLRQSWGDGLVTGGEAIVYPGVSVTPKPARPGGPPVWIGGIAEPAVRRAGRAADGFLGSWCSVEDFREQCGWVRDEAERAGRDPDAVRLGNVVPVFAWDGDDAWGRIRDHYRYHVWKYDDMAEARGRLGPPRLPPPATSEEEGRLRAMAVVGRPDEVAERLAAYEEAADAPIHLSAEFCWPGLDPLVLRESMTILAERVMPLVRG